MKYKKFDIDKFEPNVYFLILAMTSYLYVLISIDGLLVTLMLTISILCMGWMFVFGRFKE